MNLESEFMPKPISKLRDDISLFVVSDVEPWQPFSFEYPLIEVRHEPEERNGGDESGN
jgi:hypothetical protein